jgi:peptidoglycan hydrolase-like protein with peptidoglycan-binding domain
MQLGSAGTNVLRWQEFLVGQGYYWLVVSGTFDQETKVVTEMFQKEHKLTIDGKVGPQNASKSEATRLPNGSHPPSLGLPGRR